MAEDTNEDENVEPHLQSTGALLRQARELKGISLEEIAKKTRIPQRHLAALESGDFDALPGRTYTIGFAKSFARSVGLSDASIGSQLREEMEDQGLGAYQPEMSEYAPTNASSVPPRYLAWTAAGIGIFVLVGYLVWRTLILNPDDVIGFADNEATVEAAPESANPQTIAGSDTTPSSDGTVILTATETVWMKIYDAEGKRLFESEMAAGDTFTVPADADNPQILTGRPDALTVTIDGQVVPQLGTAERTIKDVGVSAAALLARGATDNPAADLSTD